MITGIKVADAMTNRPVTVDKNTTVRECAKIMAKFDIGSLLIQEKDKVQGIVTEYDFVRKVVAKGNDGDELITTIMEKLLITIEPDRDLFEAIEMMRDNEIRHLPVVSNNRFIGLITMKDVLKMEPQLIDLLVEKMKVASNDFAYMEDEEDELF